MIARKLEELSVPVVNLNGTSREELQMQCRGVFNALSNVEEQMRLMAPHGRDYQTVHRDCYTLACAQHIDRLKMIEAVKQEVLTIYESLQI